MPLYLTYREPVAHGGRLSNSVQGTVGYKDMVEFSFNDVTVQVIGGGSWLSIELLIPEGKSASFLTDKLEIYEDQNIARILNFQMTDWDPSTMQQFYFSPTSAMIGKNTSIAILGGSRPKVYVSSINFDGGDRIHYSVKPPSIRINDQVFELPVIEFTRKREVWCRTDKLK